MKIRNDSVSSGVLTLSNSPVVGCAPNSAPSTVPTQAVLSSRLRRRLNAMLCSAFVHDFPAIARELMGAGAAPEGLRPAPELRAADSADWLLAVAVGLSEANNNQPQSRSVLTPLLCAAVSDHPEQYIDLLLELGARPEGSGRTAIRYAAAVGQARSLQHLLDRGFDPGRGESSIELTALHEAVHGLRAEESTRVLLQAGANPNIRATAQRITPLHLAACHDAAEAAAVLLRHGADPALQASDGQTPVQWARDHEAVEVVALFDAYYAHREISKLSGSGQANSHQVDNDNKRRTHPVGRHERAGKRRPSSLTG